MKKNRKPTRAGVREPIQVYLTSNERSVLDRLAESLGLSRAEVLRRSLASYAVEQAKGRSPVLGLIKEMRSGDWPENAGEKHDELLSQTYLSDSD